MSPTEILQPTSTPSLDALKKSIKEKMQDNNLTSEELASLKEEIACLKPSAIAELRAFFESEFKQVREETRTSLDALLKECAPETITPSASAEKALEIK